ncbi:Hypothetical protein, putative [Bodo saltans]|uniref:Uncharacterized protein n=1 Tax=Bodo saltans TaxID=75058 RepID=A0A0S4J8U8_BODSA|nr:Hypothetical protein, putative [Bodo saltans]|eukprot:CUG87681.1 Hypothetical protein, putative [Bodo saltans]
MQPQQLADEERALMMVNMSLPAILKLSSQQLRTFVRLAHGNRRPTSYPEFLSLDVLGPGFASGALGAPLKFSEDINLQAALLASREGFSEMKSLLCTGNYQIDLPENAAMLVVTWMLEQGKYLQAKKLMVKLAPWMKEVKFVPTVVPNTPPLKATGASLGNIKKSRAQLCLTEARGAKTMVTKKPSNDVNLQLMDLQAQSVSLLVETLGPGEVPRHSIEARNLIPATCAYPLQRPLSDYGRATAQGLATKMESLLRNKAASNRHRRSSSATRTLLRVLNAVHGKSLLSFFHQSRVDDCLVARTRAIMASVLSRRGTYGSDAYTQHMKHVAIGMQGNQRHIPARVVLQRLATLEPFATLTCEEARRALAPITMEDAQRSVQSGDAAVLTVPQLKRTHRKSVLLAMEGSLDELLTCGAVKSAEEVGVVAHSLVARFKGAQFHDERLARLYSEVATAFSRRRSLLLISGPGAFQHQVRMSELPWVTPLLAELANGGADTERTATFAASLLAAYWKSFPITLMPNKMTSALRELFQPTPSKRCAGSGGRAAAISTPVLEELAADIFGGGFSGKYGRVARIAAKRLLHTAYSRYYQLDGLLQQLVDGTLTLDAAAVALKDVCYKDPTSTSTPSVHYSSVSGNGKMIEAVQILTTHNLILTDDVFSDMNPLPVQSILDAAWKQLLKLCAVVSPAAANDVYSQSQHHRQVAHAFRQFVYFVSKLASTEVQLEFLDKCLHSVVAKQQPCDLSRWIATFRSAVLDEEFHPEDRVLGWRPVVRAPTHASMVRHEVYVAVSTLGSVAAACRRLLQGIAGRILPFL